MVGGGIVEESKAENVIQFIKEHIIHRFGIPPSIRSDQGTMSTGEEMNYFVADYGIQLIRSTPLYA